MLNLYSLVPKGIHINFPGGSDGQESVCKMGDLGSVSWEDPQEKGMATRSSIFA